jgi:ferrous iron transport protein A
LSLLLIILLITNIAVKTVERTTSLNLTSPGTWLKIVSLPDGNFRAQLIRFGIHEGELVRCLERLPGGTIVLQKNRQQLAIGYQLAKRVLVVLLNNKDACSA